MKGLGAVLPPLGIAYLAAVLEKDNHEVKIIDGPALATVEEYGFNNLARDVKKFDPEVVGITASTSQIDHAKKSIRIIKKINPDCKIVLGGTLITADPDQLKNFKEVDFGVYGEADLTFKDILKKIESKKKIENLEGVIWREKKEIKFLKPKMITDMDDIPMPARHLLKMSIYKPSPANYRRLPATTMITSRGCPYQCIFCSRPTEGTAFRAHSAKRVVDEIELLINDFGIKDIQMFDDTFSLISKRAKDICKGIIERKLDIGWNCMTRVDRVDKELLTLMKKSGCYETGFGVESGNERILKFIKKGFTKDHVRNSVKLAKEVGIDVRGFFMMGFPTETKKNILETIEFAKELDVDVAQFMISTPYPGTELWGIAKKLGTISDDWNDFTFYAPDKAPYSSDVLSADEISKLYKRAYKSFYLRPGFMFKQVTKVRTFSDIHRNWLAAKGILGM